MGLQGFQQKCGDKPSETLQKLLISRFLFGIPSAFFVGNQKNQPFVCFLKLWCRIFEYVSPKWAQNQIWVFEFLSSKLYSHTQEVVEELVVMAGRISQVAERRVMKPRIIGSHQHLEFPKFSIFLCVGCFFGWASVVDVLAFVFFSKSLFDVCTPPKN